MAKQKQIDLSDFSKWLLRIGEEEARRLGYGRIYADAQKTLKLARYRLRKAAGARKCLELREAVAIVERDTLTSMRWQGMVDIWCEAPPHVVWVR